MNYHVEYLDGVILGSVVVTCDNYKLKAKSTQVKHVVLNIIPWCFGKCIKYTSYKCYQSSQVCKCSNKQVCTLKS